MKVTQFISGAFLCALSIVNLPAGVVNAYLDPNNGIYAAPPVAATATGGGGYSTGWIIDDVTPVPGYTGQSIWGQLVRVANTGSANVTADIFTAIWAADGAGGGPGTMLYQGNAIPITFPSGSVAAIIYTGATMPAGTFWVGYAFNNWQTLSTTPTELNQLSFVLAGNPTVGTSNPGSLFSTGVGGLGSNPGTVAGSSYNLANGIQFYYADTPEPGTALLSIGGLLVLAGWRVRRSLGGRV